MPIEIGTMESLKVGAGMAMPIVRLDPEMREIPATALMTDTAGVNKPSAMTPLAPTKVKISKAIRIGLISLIQDPLTGLPLKSEVESIVSVTVSISESSC
jgi:hypothetical protein